MSFSVFVMQSITKGNLVDFTCQHGDEECSGNKIHSCGLELTQSQAQQVAFVTCQMSYGTEGSDLVSFFLFNLSRVAFFFGILLDSLFKEYSSFFSSV